MIMREKYQAMNVNSVTRACCLRRSP